MTAGALLIDAAVILLIATCLFYAMAGGKPD
jgi:hypothetical protein